MVAKDYNFANSGFCFGCLSLYNASIKCDLSNCDNVNRYRIKNAAEKCDLCIYMCDGFMTSYMLGVGSGKEFDV